MAFETFDFDPFDLFSGVAFFFLTLLYFLRREDLVDDFRVCLMFFYTGNLAGDGFLVPTIAIFHFFDYDF